MHAYALRLRIGRLPVLADGLIGRLDSNMVTLVTMMAVVDASAGAWATALGARPFPHPTVCWLQRYSAEASKIGVAGEMDAGRWVCWIAGM
jgi:hypothetical protein